MTDAQAAKIRRMAESKQWTLEQIAQGSGLPTADVKQWLAAHGLKAYSVHYRKPSTSASQEPN